MPYLEHGSDSIEVTPDELVVGSGAQASWRVLDSDLAARHFSIRLAPDGSAVLRPHSPSTIVVVNGAAASQQGATLTGGEVIAAGSARFVYLETLGAARPTAGAGVGRTAYLVDERHRHAFPLTRRTISIGRDTGATIPVRDPAVSRFHADVRAEAGEFVLYSMGSAGTHVNGRRVGSPRILVEGDTIQVGAATFRFTRSTLPEGVTIAQTGGVTDESLAHRTTIPVAQEGEAPAVGRRRRQPGLIVVVLIALVLLAIGAWFILGTGR
jgi:predicted component of type VI protein secretion system